MCTKNGSYCREKEKKLGGDHGGCEEVKFFVKIQFFIFIYFLFFFWGGGGGGGPIRGWGGGGGVARFGVGG